MKSLGEGYILLVLFCSFAVISLLTTSKPGNQKYEYLAKSFLKGKSYFVNQLPEEDDVVTYRGQKYWPLGLMPAVLMMPVSLVANVSYTQGYLQMLLTIGIGFMVYLLAEKYEFAVYDRWWLVAAFCFGSVFQQAALLSSDWYVAHSVGVFFCLWGIIMTLKKKWLLAGLGFGIASLARELMVLGIGFGIIMAWENWNTKSAWLKRILLLMIPVVICVGIIFFYNYIRFQDFLPTKQHELANLGFVNAQERASLLNKGIFAFKYVPGNIYYYFIKTVGLVVENEGKYLTRAQWPFLKVDYPGVSFFVVSPVFLYILSGKNWGRVSKSALVVILPTIFILMMLYWPGWRQVGPRYLLDIFPFIYLLLLNRFKGIGVPLLAKAIILGSTWFNLYLFTLVWFVR